MSPARIGNVLNWASIIDEKTLHQAHEMASLPFLAGPLALMPDAHLGSGATIGSVIATRGAIVPAAVGVDLGCGMLAARLGMTASQLPDNLGLAHGAIRKAVPAGMGKGHDTVSRHAALCPDLRQLGADSKLKQRALAQFGTLGGGNHFIEICLDTDDDVWLVLHSGSRGVGNTLANTHIKKAKKAMKKYFVSLPDPDLAYIVQDTPEFDHYVRDMLWSQDYAFQNRQAMYLSVLDGLRSIGWPLGDDGIVINCHHNYCQQEHHHGKNCWVTRKGAISARAGELGIIPGSMGAATHIVTGLGNPSSYLSASHGAGRVLSRSAAKRDLTVESLREEMAGKTWNEWEAQQLVDEHPKAYKDIETVMKDQEDLVETVTVLRQILSFKGTK